MEFFAQTPPPEDVTRWLAVLTYLSVTVTAIIGAWRLITGKPHKTEISNTLEVSQHPGVATKHDVARIDKELNETHGRISRERKEVDRELTRITTDLTKRTDQLDTAIADNTAMTAEMKGKVDHMDQNLHSLNNSLTQFMRDQAKKS